MKKYRAGIDIGSTTVKLVVLDDADEILYGEYRRHQAHTQETLSTLLEEAKKSVGECELQVCITGSGAINLGKALDISFVQEVVAVATACRQSQETWHEASQIQNRNPCKMSGKQFEL